MSGDELLLPVVSTLDGTEVFRAVRSSGAAVQVPVSAVRQEVGGAPSVAAYDAAGDGVANDTVAIQAMATALGFVLFTRGNYRMTTTTLDVPVHFEPGAYITVDTATTVTITAPITASRQQIFRGSGLVVLGHDTDSGENARQVHVSWFGATPNASTTTDQAAAIQRAITAMGNLRESEILFDIGNYHIASAITVTRGCHILGSGTRRTVFKIPTDGFDVFTTTAVAAKFSNIQFEATVVRTANHYIRIAHGECEVYDVQAVDGQCVIVASSATNARVDNIVGTFGTDLGAGTSFIRLASGSGARVSNIMAGTSTHGPEVMVLVGGTGGGTVSGFLIENIQHSAPAASLFLEAFAGDITRGVISGIVYNGFAGTAPTYSVKFSTSSTYDLTDVALSNAVITSYATNGILFEQGSSGTMEDVSLNNVDVTGTSGIGVQFTKTGGTLQDIRVGDGVNVSERATPYGYTGSTTILQARLSPMAIPNAGPAVCYTSTVADDTVLTLSLRRSVFTGVGILSVGTTAYGVFLVRAAATPNIIAMTTASANVAITTGVLAGTTGTDGKLTVATDVATIYIENRLGSSQVVNFTLLTGL